jgi:hypothetical protein
MTFLKPTTKPSNHELPLPGAGLGVKPFAMKTKQILLLLATGVAFTLNSPATPPQIANLQVLPRSDGSGIVDIRYDLADADSPAVWVGLAVSKNHGDWFGVTPSFLELEGDFGGRVRPGTDKHIRWRADRTLPGYSGASNVVRLTASDWPSGNGPRSTTFGTYLYCRVHAALPSFLDGTLYPNIDNENFHPNQMYRPIGPDGEPIFRVPAEELPARWMELLFKQPDGATREWWTHMLRQITDAGFDFVLYSSPGQGSRHDSDCGAKEIYNPFQPAFAGRALGRVFDEMGFPLKVAFLLDEPGAWNAYNWDRMRAHYGATNWCSYKWLDNGQDPDHVIGLMPINTNTVQTYMYELMVKPFFENFNRLEDRARWQTHNDLPLAQGGRPVLHIYAAGSQWFTNFDGAGPAFQRLKDLFRADFGVEPFLAVDNMWFDRVSPGALTQLNAVADARQSYLGNWLFGQKNPPAPNSWEFKNYRITRVCPGLKGPPGRWWQYPENIMSKRWIYIDQSQGPTETWFFDRDWNLGMGATGFSRPPDRVLVAHWDEYIEGEMIGLMSDYERKDGGVLRPDFYLEHVAQTMRNFGASHPPGRATVVSPAFALTALTNAPSPRSAFAASPRVGIAPLVVQFADQSLGAPQFRAWDLNGDGVTDATGTNAWHTYATPGTYSVTLTVTNLAGQSPVSRTNLITVVGSATDLDIDLDGHGNGHQNLLGGGARPELCPAGGTGSRRRLAGRPRHRHQRVCADG